MSNVTTMNSHTFATFTDLMKERLESVLISMLDSGTITEEVAMSANDATNLFELRKALYSSDLDHIIDQHVINIVMGQYEVERVTNANVDISEFFVCKTPEEAKALRSWAGVFDVEIPTTMRVIEEHPVLTEEEWQMIENKGCEPDEVIIEEKPVIDQAKEVSKG